MTAARLPYVRAALLCEGLRRGDGGMVSAINIFDRLAVAEGTVIEATLVLMLVSAEPSTGEHQVVMQIEGVAGNVSRQEIAVAVPPEAGVCFNLLVPLRLEAAAPGTTFTISFAYDRQEQLLTRIPLHFG